MVTETAPDDRALRTARRERALAQMRAHGLDMLVLGRQANVRYVTGVPQLWVAGTRPFAPVCVLDGATGEIHLNSTWDEGVPEEIGRERLYGLTWSPMTLIDVLKDIDGASTARRVGSDAITPTFAELLPIAFPNAELVNAEPAMRAARRIKTPEELAAMSTAMSTAEAGIRAGVAALAPGVGRKDGGRRGAGGDGRRRSDDPRQPGRCLGDLAPASLATLRRRRPRAPGRPRCACSRRAG